MTRALQTIPQEPETHRQRYTSQELISFCLGCLLCLGLAPAAKILGIAWIIFACSFAPALIAVWCLYTCGAYDADALR